jgi:hypothetical protein
MNLIKSTIDLFNAIPKEKALEYGATQVPSKELIEYGIFVDSEVISKNVKNMLIDLSLQINKSFYSSWNQIKFKDRNEIFIDQTYHYITVWLKNNEQSEKRSPKDLVLVPNKTFLNQAPLAFKIIKILPLKEIKNKAKQLLYSNIALKEETIKNIFNIISYTEIKINEIKNRDSKILVLSKLRIIPKDPVDLLKCIIYDITGNLNFVKNKALYFDIKNKITQNSKTLFWIKNNEALLAQIFNRFKYVFLTLKSDKNLIPYINKIGHLSKTYHVPQIKLEPSNGFQIVKHYQNLINNKQPRSFVVRNGKIWCERNRLNDIEKYKSKVEKMFKNYTSIKESPFTKIAFPLSEKNFSGNYPMRSEFFHNNLIIGIFWKNNSKRVDLDLSCIDLEGVKIGWDSDFYKDRNKDRNEDVVIFSGDIIDAPNGANEYLFFKNKIPKLVQVNYFNFDSNLQEAEFDIIIAYANDENMNKLISSENIIATIRTSINCRKTKTLGIVYPGGKFVLIDKYLGKNAQSNGIVKKDLEIVVNSFTEKTLFFKDFLKEGEENFIDLRKENISKSDLINIFNNKNDF